MNKPMELDVWKGDWGLPSVDLDCLETLAYIKFCGVSVKVNQKSNPFWTPTGTLPLFKHNKQKLMSIDEIAAHLQKKNFSPDFALNSKQTADVVAFKSMIKEQLFPALQYLWWFDEKSYTTVTRPWYCKVLPFPLNFHYPNKFRSKATDLMDAMFSDVTNNDVIQIELFAAAERCLATLSARLGEQEFVFGAHPCSLDAHIYAHLAPLMRVPFPANQLQNYARSCLNLHKYVTRISQRYFPHEYQDYEQKQKKLREESEKKSGDSLFKAKDKVFATVFAALAMIMYAVAKGFIQVSDIEDGLRKSKSYDFRESEDDMD
ncbi:metaxin-1 [Nilaparvata lugens]|uniref:metaxin-1 n=1 Tax=Nilaparvata lugens TaxID=108931 RepID=UPI00193E9FA0|nr:metaxin-1 [Nilaparvata lugens]